jgi:hypothetical protein
MNAKNNNQNHPPDLIDYLFDDIAPFFGQALLIIPKTVINTINFIARGGKAKKDNRIILGSNQEGKEHHIYPVERNEHTAIMGEPGTGKSLLAIKIARQAINLGTRTLVVDPHGDTVKALYQTIKDTKNIVFYSLNRKLQANKVIGFNPLYLLGDLDTINQYTTNLHKIIFGNAGMEIKIQGKFLLESVSYFNNCYPFYLASKDLGIDQITEITKTKQITFKDLTLIMNGDRRIVELFLEILQTECKYKRPDLVRRWSEVLIGKKLPPYLIQASKRFDEYTQNVESNYFLESTGFDVIEDLKANKNVLIDLKGVDPEVSGLISSLIFSKLANMHKNQILKGQTELIIDEAKTITIPNLEEIITECRKDQLAVTLIFQYLGQFDNQPETKKAIENAISHTCEFQNKKGAIRSIDNEEVINLKKFQFVYNYKGIKKELTVGFSKELRPFEYQPRGEEKSIVSQRMQNKLNNIYNYFTKI